MSALEPFSGAVQDKSKLKIEGACVLSDTKE